MRDKEAKKFHSKIGAQEIYSCVNYLNENEIDKTHKSISNLIDSITAISRVI